MTNQARAAEEKKKKTLFCDWGEDIFVLEWLDQLWKWETTNSMWFWLITQTIEYMVLLVQIENDSFPFGVWCKPLLL